MPLFARLSVSELQGVHSNAKVREFASDEHVLTNGNVRRSLFIILQGSVKVFGKNKEQPAEEITEEFVAG